ncbi:hypothetical protein CALCODRAFT_428603 [Calocera cornea HHB12733]|uniref:Integrase core domain-containing protein n=1 Tax=Calocera cornea HHB12733 TaxID=1353952 RepID=A0A165IQG9_9BASI|nr:hypothetical protein CALCODRAFT_428603 [Calocera cornea HHB12733]
MLQHRGRNRGSYIWGRSVHNTRIERLWVDVTNSFGRKWSRFFYNLETNHGLNHLNEHHIWLLQHLFLSDMNNDAVAFQNEWNEHTLALPGRNQRPAVLFLAGCIQLGARGIDMQSQDDEEYGRDPQGFGVEQDRRPVHSHNDDLSNTGFQEDLAAGDINNDEVPPRLNVVDPVPSTCPLRADQLRVLNDNLEGYLTSTDPITLAERWRRAFAICTRFMHA